MQYLGSVQNLEFSLSSWFPHRFESEDHAIPWFCQKLRFSLSSWFLHIFESEDHAIPWFCPKLIIFFKFGGISPSAKVWDVDLTLEAPRTVRATDTSKRSP